ncbi:unnamed protein product [Closterium sp. NIES-54]
MGVVAAVVAVAVELFGGEFLAVASCRCSGVSARPFHPSSYVSGMLVGVVAAAVVAVAVQLFSWEFLAVAWRSCNGVRARPLRLSNSVSGTLSVGRLGVVLAARTSFAQSEGFGFESQCVHFGHPSAGGCQRSTGDPRLIIGKGYRLVVMGGYGRTYPLLNKPFYPNGLVVGILTSWPHSSLRGVSCRGRRLRRGGRRHHWPRSRVAPHLRAAMPVVQVVLDCQVLVIVLAVLVRLHFAGTCVRPSVPRFLQSFRGVVAAARSIQTVLRECRDVDMFIHNEGRRLSLV